MSYDINKYQGRKPEYLAKRKALAEKWVEDIKSMGLHAEMNFEGEVSISLTGFGLEQVYAQIGLDELEYHLDNREDEL